MSETYLRHAAEWRSVGAHRIAWTCVWIAYLLENETPRMETSK